MHPWTSPTGCLTYRRVRALPRALQGGGVHSCTLYGVFRMLYVISLYLTQLEHAYMEYLSWTPLHFNY